MTMFHAHRAVVDADGLGWRVDGGGGPTGGRDSRNRRTILSCPGDPEYRDGYRPGNRMHIGDQPSSLHANPSSDLNELFKFHEHLYVQGYVNAPGLMPLIDNQALGHQFNRYGELEALPYRWIQSNREARRPGNDIWSRPCKNSHIIIHERLMLTERYSWDEFSHTRLLVCTHGYGQPSVRLQHTNAFASTTNSRAPVAVQSASCRLSGP